MTDDWRDLDGAVLAEACRRAQMAGRPLPLVCDFPASIAAAEVQSHYMPRLLAAQDSRSVGSLEGSPVFMVCHPLADVATAPPTWGGDSVAGMMRMGDLGCLLE